MKEVFKKMTRRHSVYNLIGIFLALVVLIGCHDDEVDAPHADSTVKGHVQKGPFVIGTTVTVSELNPALDQTGNTYSAQTSDNSGLFELSGIHLATNYIECSSSGFYFDEVKGSLSLAPLNLHSVSDITDKASINVNILTHLEQPRVKFLVAKQNSFAVAKKTAQADVLGIFGFASGNLNRSELLDISSDSEGNAMLLAVSVILQGNRTVGDLSELLATISNNIKEDGILNSDTIISSLRVSTRNLALEAIRSNLEKRYRDLGIQATIPNFEKYINHFLESTGAKPEVSSAQSSGIEASGAKLGALVNANSLATSVTFEYGTTTEYGQQTSAISVSGFGDNNVNATLANLLPGKVYHWRTVAVNAKGTASSPDMTFTTLGLVPAISSPQATALVPTGATLKALVNANYLTTDVSFEYGTTTEYSKATPAVSISGAVSTPVAAALSGLLPGTTYHWRVVAVNSLGTTSSEDMTFTTPGQIPTVTTLASTEITSTAVVLNGTVNSNYLPTTVIFEYGTTLQYGQTITASPNLFDGNVGTAVSARITGLTSGTRYYFRIKASNVLGEALGTDLEVTPTFMINGKELGGTVAYILQSGDPGYVPGETHGFIMASESLTKNYQQTYSGVTYEGVPWYNGTYLVTGATGTALGTGFANTTAIVNAQGNTGVYGAKLCRDYRGGGYYDWFMPSKDELAKLYENRQALGLTGYFWSSTEFDVQGACYHHFEGNEQMCGFWKYNIFPIRAIRAF